MISWWIYWSYWELSDNLMWWGYIGKILAHKSLIFWHVALTLSHLNLPLTIHSNPPYFLHSPSLTHSHPLTHPIFPTKLHQTIIYSHLSPLFTTPTHIIYLSYPSPTISNHSSTPILSDFFKKTYERSFIWKLILAFYMINIQIIIYTLFLIGW